MAEVAHRERACCGLMLATDEHSVASEFFFSVYCCSRRKPLRVTFQRDLLEASTDHVTTSTILNSSRDP